MSFQGLQLNTMTEIIDNIKSKSSRINKKNRYASPDMKLLINKYKKKQIMDSVNVKLTEIEKTTEYDNQLFEDSKHTLTTTTNFRTRNFFNSKTPKLNYFSQTNLTFQKPKKKEFIYEENELDRERKLNNENFLRKHFSTYKQANSIYSLLNKRTKYYLDSINKYIHRVKGSDKKIVLGLSPFPNTSMNREFRFQDSSNKCVSIYDKSFGSPAIGERYERHMSELLRLKHVMNNIKETDSKKRDEYSYRMLSNYLAQNGIFDKKFYTEDFLYNFKEFLEIDFEVHPDVPYKKFLYDILYGYYDKYVQNPMDSNNSSLAYYEKNKFGRNYLFNTFNSFRSNSHTINASKRNKRVRIEAHYSCDDVPVQQIENQDDAKKFGKLLEFICLERMKKKETLDNCFNKIKNGQKISV